MAEKAKGTPEESTATEAPVEDKEPETTEEAETQQADEGGQPAEDDIKSVVEEMRSSLDSLKEELKRSQHDANYYKTLVFGQEKPPEKEEPETQQPTSEDFWKDPLGAIDRRLDEREKRRLKEQEKRTRAEMARKYEENDRSGLTTVTTKNPAFYKGIETDVAEYVKSTAIQSNLPPEQLSSPELWDAAAFLIRWQKGERDFSRYFKSSPKAVSNVSTERPGPAVPPKPKSVISDKEKELIKTWDITEEQYLAAKKKEQEG
jgi:hypothetical protein